MSYFLYTLALTLETIASLIFFLLLANAISSWIPPFYYSKIGQIIRKLSHPILFPFKKLLNLIPFMRNLPIDFSPVAAILVIDTLVGILSTFLRLAAYNG